MSLLYSQRTVSLSLYNLVCAVVSRASMCKAIFGCIITTSAVSFLYFSSKLIASAPSINTVWEAR